MGAEVVPARPTTRSVPTPDRILRVPRGGERDGAVVVAVHVRDQRVDLWGGGATTPGTKHNKTQILLFINMYE